MNTVDWVLLSVLLLSGLWGVWHGVVKEVFSLLAWVLGFVLSIQFAVDVSQVLPLSWAQGLRMACAWVLIFLLVLLVMGLLASLLKQLLSMVGLGLIDRFLGGVFGLLRATIMLLAITLLVGLTPLKSNLEWMGSRVAQTVHLLLVYLKPVLPAQLERLVT
jgi:membrane protein required for colicin V production